MHPGTYWFTRCERRSPEPWMWAGVPDLDQFYSRDYDGLTTADGPLLRRYNGSDFSNTRTSFLTMMQAPRPVAFPNPFKYRQNDQRYNFEVFPGSHSWTSYYEYPSGLLFIPTSTLSRGNYFIPERLFDLGTTAVKFNEVSPGVFAPHYRPPLGVLIVVGRNGKHTTPDTATPYVLSVEIDGVSAWSETVNPLADPPDMWFVPCPTPLDAAIRTLRSSVASDANHPHILTAYGLTRVGSFHAPGDLPSGYVATVPPVIQTVIPSIISPDDWAGKWSAIAPVRLREQYDLSMRAATLGMDIASNDFDGLPRVNTGNDIVDICRRDTMVFNSQNEGFATSGGILDVDESGVIDFFGESIIASPGSVVSTFVVTRDSAWGRGGGTGSTTEATITTPAGPGTHQTSVTLAGPIPKGGGRVTFTRTSGTWYSSRISCRKTYAGRPHYPVVIANADGTEGILPGGVHPDQVITTMPIGAVRVSGPDGGGEIEIDWAAMPADGIPCLAHVSWKECDPGLYVVERAIYDSSIPGWGAWERASGVATGVGLSPMSYYMGYTHAGTRYIANQVTKYTSYTTKVRYRSIKTATSAVQAVTVGTTTLTKPARPSTPSWITSYVTDYMPHLFAFTAPSDGRFRVRIIRKGTSDTAAPYLLHPSMVMATASTDVDGYRHNADVFTHPEMPEITSSFYSAVQNSYRPDVPTATYPTSHPYAAGHTASWIISKATDWTGTPWEGHGGELALCYIPRTTGSGAQPLPASPNWQFFPIAIGTIFANSPLTGGSTQMLIRDDGEASGWRSVPLTTGLDIYDATHTMTTGQVVQFRVAVNTAGGGWGAWQQLSFTGLATSDRLYAEITAL